MKNAMQELRDLAARFTEGESVDVAKYLRDHGNPEAADKWEAMNEEYGDLLKKAAKKPRPEEYGIDPRKHYVWAVDEGDAYGPFNPKDARTFLDKVQSLGYSVLIKTGKELFDSLVFHNRLDQTTIYPLREALKKYRIRLATASLEKMASSMEEGKLYHSTKVSSDIEGSWFYAIERMKNGKMKGVVVHQDAGRKVPNKAKSYIIDSQWASTAWKETASSKVPSNVISKLKGSGKMASDVTVMLAEKDGKHVMHNLAMETLGKMAALLTAAKNTEGEYWGRRAKDSKHVKMKPAEAKKVIKQKKGDGKDWLAVWLVPPEYVDAKEQDYRIKQGWINPVWEWNLGPQKGGVKGRTAAASNPLRWSVDWQEIVDRIMDTYPIHLTGPRSYAVESPFGSGVHTPDLNGAKMWAVEDFVKHLMQVAKRTRVKLGSTAMKELERMADWKPGEVDPEGSWTEGEVFTDEEEPKPEGSMIPGLEERMAALVKTAAAPSGLYGYTKRVQADCESATRKIAKRALLIAKNAYRKDERVAQFLAMHAKRAKSSSARIILTALKEMAPKVASYNDDEASWPHIATDSRDVILQAKRAGVRSYGLYGFPTKTASLGLSACTQLREAAGHVASDMHVRRAAKHALYTGFLKQHSKEAKCHYARLLHASYPEANTKVAATAPSTVAGWLSHDE